MTKTLTFCCLLLLCGCSERKHTAHEKQVQDWQRLQSVQFYWEGERTNRLERFSAALSNMDESTYWSTPTNQLSGQFYRFLWLRTFHNPILVRITSVGHGRWEVRSKRLTGQGGFDLGQLAKDEAVTNDSQEIVSLAADLDRWLPYVPEYDGDLGCDGATWFIDGVHEGHYFMVHTSETGDVLGK
jgi:hypothetical protein